MVVLNDILDQMIKVKGHLSKPGEEPQDIELKFKAKLKMRVLFPP